SKLPFLNGVTSATIEPLSMRDLLQNNTGYIGKIGNPPLENLDSRTCHIHPFILRPFYSNIPSQKMYGNFPFSESFQHRSYGRGRCSCSASQCLPCPSLPDPHPHFLFIQHIHKLDISFIREHRVVFYSGPVNRRRKVADFFIQKNYCMGIPHRNACSIEHTVMDLQRIINYRGSVFEGDRNFVSLKYRLSHVNPHQVSCTFRPLYSGNSFYFQDIPG